MKTYILLLSIVAVIFCSCEDDPINLDSCGPVAEFSDVFDEVPTDPYTIQSAVINDKCLTVEVAASGCDGASWEAQMLISPVVALSYPPQAGIRLILEDDEACEAFVTRIFTFDLSPLDSISDKVWVRLEGLEGMLIYPGLDAEDLVGEWGLFSFSSGLLEVSEEVDSGAVMLNFSNSEVEVNTLNEGIFPFQTGTYDYKIENRDDDDILFIDNFEIGVFQFESHDVFSILDQRPLNGIKYIFSRGYVKAPSDCGSYIIESASKYESAESDSFEIIGATIVNNCLQIEFAASGCDGSTWEMEMVDAQQILESFPVQRRLRMLLQNQEVCDAVITRSIQFDLTTIQLSEYNEILIGIEGVDELISYRY